MRLVAWFQQIGVVLKSPKTNLRPRHHQHRTNSAYANSRGLPGIMWCAHVTQPIDPTNSQSLAESPRTDLRASLRTTLWSCASFDSLRPPRPRR